MADLVEQPERAGRAEAGAPVNHPDPDRLGQANPTLHDLPCPAVCSLLVGLNWKVRTLSLGVALPACSPGCYVPALSASGAFGELVSGHMLPGYSKARTVGCDTVTLCVERKRLSTVSYRLPF